MGVRILKILIYKNKCELAPTGGPNGYLYNLNQGLNEIGSKEVEFLDFRPNPIIKKLKDKIKRFKFGKKLADKRWEKRIIENYLNGKTYPINIDFNDYDIIHFHSTMDMYERREELKDCRKKIILTSHSPKPLSMEIIDLLKDKNVKDIEKYEKLIEIDRYAFNRADYIIFPCKEAEEPYYNQWNEYEKIHIQNEKKYRYLLSGIKACSATTNKEEIRKKYNIPADAFLVSYVGRHNEVKGYDTLKEIGKMTLERNKSIYFIIAGSEGPIYRLENERWIEVGWTNDPHSIISASDLFILPNKETYFDLVLLEVLSLGIPVLISHTGGNKHFEKYEDSGIMQYCSVEEAVDKIIHFSKLDNEERKKIGKSNLKIFEENFNEKIFAENYIQLMKKI
jgi:glycosyltransferase involved in cell wall biosynthesis